MTSVGSVAQRVSPDWACPQHGSTLQVVDGVFRCSTGHTFPVVNGIPRFVPQTNYADAFGLQWNQYRRTQLDSYTGLNLSKERLERCFGTELFLALAGKTVLEAGCGAGRFTEVLLDAGAHVTSLDLSTAVEANQDNCPQGQNHRIAQADIRALPFDGQQFDVVLCLGVVQHTPDSEQTVADLYAQVKPGGWLVFDHYTWNYSSLTRFGQIARLYFLRLPPDKSLRQCEKMTKALLPIHKRLKRFGRLVSRVSPVLSYYHVIPELSDELQEQWALLDTHDTLTDRYKHHRSISSLSRTMQTLGAQQISAQKAGNGIEVRASRPL